jgi:hypothetical protein
MAAPKGNKFWEARSKSGRGKIFETPEDLKAACCEYFEWVEENPLWESKAFPFQGQVTVEVLPRMRAMTKAGLCIFLDIAETTWDTYRGRKDFLGVVTWAESVIYTQKFSGAAADLLNPNIIARDLGLSDKTQTEHSGSIDINKMSDEELERKIAELSK